MNTRISVKFQVAPKLQKAKELLKVESWSILQNNVDALRKEYGVTGKGIKVAVLDTGINKKHEVFMPVSSLSVSNSGANTNTVGLNAGAIKKIKSVFKKRIVVEKKGRRNIYGIVDDPDTSDNLGHGTFCASVIASNNPNISVAPDAELYIGKVLNNNGLGTVESISDGIEWAISEEVDIINLSLGYTGILHPLIKDSLLKALSKNIIVVCAAGNEGPYDGTISSPGNFSKLITVGACDKSNNIATFSSRGVQIDFVAPGVDILGAFKSPNFYAVMSGTSMAAPYVSGCAALFLELYKKKNNIEKIHSSLSFKGKNNTDLIGGEEEEVCLCFYFECECKSCCKDLLKEGFDTSSGEGVLRLENLLKSI